MSKRPLAFAGFAVSGDHCLSNSIIQTLREANHEVLRLKDLLPVESSDAAVIAKAKEIGAILLSLNGDFADIVNLRAADGTGLRLSWRTVAFARR